MKNILTERLIEKLSEFVGAYTRFLPLGGLFSLALFILFAYSVYEISKKEGFKSPWISFIPVVSDFALGRIAEKYVAANGKRSAKMSVLLIAFKIASIIAAALFAVFTVIAVIRIGGNLEEVVANDSALDTEALTSLVPVFVSYLFVLGCGITHTVLYYISLYRTYSMLERHNATLFLVLSIFFSFMSAIFMFILRNKPLKTTEDERNNYATVKTEIYE